MQNKMFVFLNVCFLNINKTNSKACNTSLSICIICEVKILN